ncbi:hypothetical protein ACN42_g6258 [Penicillium freii]|uniref:Uncharacterized protein n=1 Tax=Penicillium freii TaxID=48697 RepID=A0A101MHX3_PENFR|nr:hypothetical protein ACN42_g6258 [Penicillium freii]
MKPAEFGSKAEEAKPPGLTPNGRDTSLLTDDHLTTSSSPTTFFFVFPTVFFFFHLASNPCWPCLGCSVLHALAIRSVQIF